MLAANRDELVARPAAPPALLAEEPPIAGGRDLLAGGTWLAVSADSRVCAVTNRRLPGVDEVTRDPARLSRGGIPVEVLAEVTELRGYLEGLGPGRYNPVNVLYVSREHAVVAAVDDTGPPRITELTPGLHILTVGDVDDPVRPKDEALARRLNAAVAASKEATTLEIRMRMILGEHRSATEDPLDAACIHGDVYGTVSSSTVIAGEGPPRYRHAPGRPCLTPFALVGALSAPDGSLRRESGALSREPG